ncbi:hypothetical protein OS493_032114 [Desmophyllum pertusum]|uniref:Sulfite exporter TauE/SafE family protein n=1 Tax=Desmophyllum pertusum TaxID=174260 RepID=A0A9X0CKE0_9CNID|nr:hypothetical protein OS493_032114 [Desmophyllum pertusum]
MEQKYSTVNGEIAIDFPGDGNYNQAPLHSSTFDQVQRSTFAIENQQPNEQIHPDKKTNVKKRRTSIEWIKKYFLEGQALTSTQTQALEALDVNAPWHERLIVKHRRLVGVAIPFIFFQVIWWSCAIKYNFWSLFPDRFFISITMIFGSMIAGMTSEGGGAVAFPVMTLAFGIAPAVARDFSLMIQSCGMTAAAFTIFWMRVQLEWHSIIFCSLGGIVGMAIGLEFIDPNLTPPQKKIGFVCAWFSFAFALFLLNLYHKRKTYKTIPDFKLWKMIVLLLTGFLGGIFSAIAGSGVDICSFSILTLLFRVSEKTATPTSVVLMAGNTVVGFYWRQVIQQAVSADAYYYLAVCIPIVVLGAPLGSVIGSHFHRQALAGLIYVLDTVALISAYAIVPLTKALIGASVGIIAFGFVFFGLITYAGQKIMEEIEKGNEELQQMQINSEEEAKEKGMKPAANKNLNNKREGSGKEKYEVHKLDTLLEA